MGNRTGIVCFVKGCRLHHDLDTANRHLVCATADTIGIASFGVFDDSLWSELYEVKPRNMTLLFLKLGTTELFIVLPLLAFMFYSLFHAATNMAISGTHRLIWGLLILSYSLAWQYWVLGGG